MNTALWLIIDAASILTGAGAHDIPGPPLTPPAVIEEYTAPATDTTPEIGVWRCLANPDNPTTDEVEVAPMTFVYGGPYHPWVDEVCVPESEYVNQ
jgi:hypothetical protein